MKNAIFKILTAVGGLCGALFVVLFFLQYYNVFDVLLFCLEHEYVVYIAMAIAAVYLICILTALVAPRAKAKQKEKNLEGNAVSPAATVAAPAATASETADSEKLDIAEDLFAVSADVPSVKNDETADSGLFSESSREAEPAEDALPKKDTAESASRMLSDGPEQAEEPSKTRAEFQKDWRELEALLGDEYDVSDIEYTGTRQNDELDLDREFIVESTDEAVAAPVEKPASPVYETARAPKKDRAPAADVNSIIEQINELIDLVSEQEGKKR